MVPAMKKKIVIEAVLISAVLSLAACSPIHMKSGRPFVIDQIQSIEKEKTDKDAVSKLFGEPQMRGKDDAGLDTWTYFYMSAVIPLKGGDVKENVRRLTITFDGGKVKTYSYELSD